MCATYFITLDEKEMREIIAEIEKEYEDVPVSTGDVYYKSMLPVQWLSDGAIKSRPMYWGLPLDGKKDVNHNARQESVRKFHSNPKSVYFDTHPIIIPTNGFYEWKGPKGSKEKYLLSEPEQNITYIAGLCKVFQDRDDGIYPYRYTMLTTAPTDSFKAYHHREPLVIHKEEREEWLRGKDIRGFFDRNPFDLSAKQVMKSG